MELMEKGSLYNLLHDETFTLDGEIVLPILRDVGKSFALASAMTVVNTLTYLCERLISIAQGVRFLHAADPQIVHSDLKVSGESSYSGSQPIK